MYKEQLYHEDFGGRASVTLKVNLKTGAAKIELEAGESAIHMDISDYQDLKAKTDNLIEQAIKDGVLHKPAELCPYYIGDEHICGLSMKKCNGLKSPCDIADEADNAGP